MPATSVRLWICLVSRSWGWWTRMTRQFRTSRSPWQMAASP